MSNDKLSQMFSYLSSAASVAADSVSGAVEQAGKSVNDKYDVIKIRFEIRRLQEDQNKIFSDIGRTLFLSSSNSLNIDVSSDQAAEAQQTVDRLLILADQKQQEIDFALERLAELDATPTCDECANPITSSDRYCATCGTKLSE